MTEKFLIPCSTGCGIIIERVKKGASATCFECKRKRINKRYVDVVKPRKIKLGNEKVSMLAVKSDKKLKKKKSVM